MEATPRPVQPQHIGRMVPIAWSFCGRARQNRTASQQKWHRDRLGSEGVGACSLVEALQLRPSRLDWSSFLCRRLKQTGR
jgi:hypothetical protein